MRWRVIVTVVTALAALLVLAPAAAAATAVTAGIGGVEYAATDTEGRFGGAANGQVPGAWLATVVHDPLSAGAVPITGGSFTLRSTRGDVGGTFVGGEVVPLDDLSTCDNQRFDVTGTLELDGGGQGSFTVVLTHLLAQTDSGCHVYGAVVAGSLTVPAHVLAA